MAFNFTLPVVASSLRECDARQAETDVESLESGKAPSQFPLSPLPSFGKCSPGLHRRRGWGDEEVKKTASPPPPSLSSPRKRKKKPFFVLAYGTFRLNWTTDCLQGLIFGIYSTVDRHITLTWSKFNWRFFHASTKLQSGNLQCFQAPTMGFPMQGAKRGGNGL